MAWERPPASQGPGRGPSLSSAASSRSPVPQSSPAAPFRPITPVRPAPRVSPTNRGPRGPVRPLTGAGPRRAGLVHPTRGEAGRGPRACGDLRDGPSPALPCLWTPRARPSRSRPLSGPMSWGFGQTPLSAAAPPLSTRVSTLRALNAAETYPL